MKLITKLKGTAAEDKDFREAPVHHPAFGEETDKGHRRMMKCGPEGVIFTNGKESIAIPMAELWQLAEAAEPALKAGPVKIISKEKEDAAAKKQT